MIIGANPNSKIWSAGHDIREIPLDGHDAVTWTTGFERVLRRVRDVDVEEKVEQFVTSHGHKPRIFICKLGQDGHDRGQEVVGAALSDLGFDVVLGPLFQTPDEAARQAVEDHVDIVAPSSLAAGHLTLVPALREALAKLDRKDMPIVIGGVIPPQDYDELYRDGALAIFGPGTAIPGAGLKILEILEHQGRQTATSAIEAGKTL